MRRTGTALVVAALRAAVGTVGSQAAPPSASTYVVVLRPGSDDVGGVATALARAHGGVVGFVYTHALRGFSVRVPAAGAAAIAHSPGVAYVEADQVYSVAAQSMPTGIQRIFAPDNAAVGIDGSDDRRVDVDVAVIDSGIQLDHPDLNVVGSTNCATFFATCGSGGGDGNGHGTHVAGTIGALDNGIGVVGVAPGARLWSVRVLNNSGTGTTSQIIAGMDWVTARAATIEVANVSITGGTSAVGRQRRESHGRRRRRRRRRCREQRRRMRPTTARLEPRRCSRSRPMADYDGLPGALSAPPSSFCPDQDDTLADFSNWGATIEIAAPGCRILSTYPTSGYAWVNGTSMASPHVAGALALLASNGFVRTWTGVSALYSTCAAGGQRRLDRRIGRRNQEPLLDVHDPAVFNPKTVGSGGGTNQPPTASFTFSCSGLACSFAGSGSESDGTIASLAWTFGDGGTGTGATVSHAYASAGTYGVTLTATDDDGATGSSSGNVTVTTPAEVALQGGAVSTGSRWDAKVTIGVAQNGSPISTNASWTWSNGATGSWTCASTPCTVTKTGIRNRTTSVTFTVDTVGGSSSFGGQKSIVVPAP